MDKNTLSNYGWIVIAVLVLSVMIALATPFGSYIEQGVRSTTAGLFDTSEKALNVVGMSAGDGNFENGYQGVDNSETESTIQAIGSATFSGYYDANFNFIEGKTTLTWQELQKTENGEKFHYDASKVTDTQIGNNAFEQTPIIEITIPNTVVYIGEHAFTNSFIKNITIPSSVQEFGYGSFVNIQTLESAILSEGVTKIGDNMFGACINLQSISLPSTLTYIGESAFDYCMSLSQIDIPQNVTTIGMCGFADTNFTHITIPDKVTIIEHQLFTRCPQLTAVTFGKNITQIGFRVFEETPIETIYFQGSKADWQNISIMDGWNMTCAEIAVVCTDGTITIPAWE